MKKLLITLIPLIQFIVPTSLQAQCDASFTTSVDCNCVTFTPTFVDSSCTYTWDFGLGGEVSNEVSPTFCYSFTGNGVSSVNVNLGIECSGSGITCDSSINVTVQQVPDAQLEPLNAAGWLNCRADINNPNFTLLVENTSTTVSTNQTYIINWGDSTLVNGQMVANIETFDGTFANASHLYQQLLTYEIIVTVIGQNGCSTSQAYTFINGSANPDIGLELDGTSNECIGYMGRFIISNTEDNPPFTRYLIRIDNDDRDSFFFNHPPPDTFEYVFNTGSCFDTTIISSVTYPHSFSVSITAIVDSCGSSTAAVGPIRIDEPPLAAFSIEPDSIQCVRKDTFRLTNESIPGDYNILGTDDCSDSTWYYWTVFPDANYTVTEGTLGLYNDFPSLATQGSTDGISLVFNAPGEYTLSLIAQSYFGSVCDTSMAVKTICVLPDPVANFTASTTLTCGPADITFTNTSNTLGACEAAQYNWSVDFLESECGSDSIFRFVGSNNISPTIRFEGSGQYRVELEVINRCDTSRHEQIITIARSSIVEIDSIQDACLSTVITPSFENLTDCYAPGNCMWFIPNASNPAIIDTFMGCDPPAISYNIVGTYTIGVKVTNDCGESTDTETFTLFDLPDIPDITTNGPVCFGDDFCLTVSNLGPNQIIEWLGPQGWVSTSLSDCLDEVRSADAGRYQLTVTDTITGCSNVGSTTLTVLLLPDLDLNPEEPELCLGDTLPIDIIRRSATVHTWFPDYNISTTSGTSVEVYPTVDTTYIVISTDTITGCRRVDSLFVDVHPLPDVSAGPDTFVCVGQDLQLGGTPAGGIWMDAQGGILSQGIFNENITGLYTLYYDFTDAQGCFGQDSLTVCVLNNPLASFTIDTSAACVGATIQTTNTSNVLNDCLAAEYHWSVSFDGADCHADSSGWSFSSGNANSLQPAFDFQRSGQYTIELEIVHPCNTVRSSRTVVIGEAPTVQIDSLDLLCETLSIRPTASVSLCDGGLQATYSWSFPDATNLNTFNGPNPPVITYPGTGTYTIQLSVTNACGTTADSYTFEIFDRPVVMPQNSGPICEGDDLQLFANSTAGVAPSWTGPNNFQSNDLNPIIPNAGIENAGLYELTITDANGCTSTGATMVVVLLLPDIVLSSADTDICFGDTTTIRAFGADVYNWTPALGLNTNLGPTVSAFPATTTTYFVEGLDTLTGCRSLDSIQIIVNSLPVVEAGVDTFSCAGADHQLGGSPMGGTWTDEQGNPISQGIFNQSTPGTYTLFYDFTNPEGCSSRDSLVVCVLSNPESSFAVDTLVGCVGAIIQTSNESNTLNDCLAASYRWSVSWIEADCHNDSSGWNFSSGNANSLQPAIRFTRSGRYRIQLEVANACDTVSSFQTVVIGEAPDVQIDSLNLLCEEFTVRPTATVSLCNSASQSSYSWFFPGADIGTFDGVQPPAITYGAVGSYTISLIVTNPCGTTTASYTFEIFDRPTAMPSNNSPICVGEDLELMANAPTAEFFQWEGPNNFSSTEENPRILNATLANVGAYQVTVTDGNGCTSEATTSVSILPLPNVDLVASDITPCFGDTSLLYVQSDSTYNYNWASTAGLSSSTGDTIRIFPSTPSWYFLTSTNPTSGCQSTDSIFIDVVPLPIVEAGPNVDACAGGDLQLQASPAGGVWTDEQGNIIPNGLFNSTVPDTYKVYYTFTNAEGCSATDSTRVCVLSIPQADFQIDATAGCQPLRISATNNSNVLLDCSPATYTWRVLFNGAECHDDNSGWTFVSGGPNTEDATFLFTLSGRYAIELEVTNACGTSSYREEVIVGDVPSIQLTELPNLCNEFEVQPTIDVLSDCNGSRSSLVWTFDPTASLASWQGENPPLITYNSVGQKTITVVATNDCGSSSQTINFNIFELPDLNVNNDGPKCEGENIQLSAGSSNSSLVYLWAGPENFSSSLSNPLLVDVGLSNAGTYVLQAIDTLTGCSNVDSTLVVVDTLTVVSAGADMDFCPGDGSMRLTGTPSGGAWSGITTTGLINPANQAAGTYLAIYTVTNSFGCSSSDTANITIHPPALEESFIDVFCAEDSIVLNGTRYNINNPRGQEVFVSSQTGCDSLILDVDIEFISLSLSFRRTNPSCFGDSNGSIIIDTILGGTAPYAVDLDGTGASIVSDFPFVIGGLQAGSYNLTIEDVNGCQLIRDDLQIFQPEELIIKLGRDTIIELGDSIELRVLNDDGRPLFLPDSSIRWEIISSDTTIICPACPTSITVRPLNMTSVTATYTNDNGCSSSDDLVLSIDKRERVYIPNAFTPNGDGFNDRFTIFSDNDVERIKLLRIFDRWGDLVFEMRDFLPNDPDLGWDGYFKGQRMNPAVFAYYAEVLFKDGRIEFFKGDVTLVR